MRVLGTAERALAMPVDRAGSRVALCGPLLEQEVVRQPTAESRLEIEQTRPLCHHACHVIDTGGTKAARNLVAWPRPPSPRATTAVVDRAMLLFDGRTWCTCGRWPGPSRAASPRWPSPGSPPAASRLSRWSCGRGPVGERAVRGVGLAADAAG
ncbi:acyl-CoA dehydrogenase family protein [Actinokineospora sp. G85]|uniref:acyl-CoA dehydrogenase family protein n=1 Tax=Actinokineospora sp. G85 TaxID=3406626 RepID=UPI003C7351AF